jgi:hypothetical protein
MNAPNRTVVALLSLLPLSGLAWLFAANVQQYWFVGDDAFISFRYARHLSEGFGLVWNPGERVEGYTNFLWVLMMSAAIGAGFDPVKVSNVLGVASGVGVLALLLAFSAWRTSWRNPYIWVAPLALAASRTFSAWSTGGLETMFFTLLVLAALVCFVRERDRSSRLPLGSALLFSLASLTRPEGILFGAVAGCFFAAEIAVRRRPLRAGLAWALPCVLLVGGHFLWRYAYYGFWLPNTFYAKMPGAWWDQGIAYLEFFDRSYHVLWFSPLLLASLALRRDFTAALFSAVSAAYLLYIAYVGGDRFEFRFLVVVLPCLYWLIADGAFQMVARAPRPGWSTAALHLLAGAVAVALLAATHLGPQQPAAKRMRRGVNLLEAIGHYARARTAEGLHLRRMVEAGLLPDDLVLCVGGAGALPYYTDWVTIDRHGLNDVEVAHAPLPRRGLIGHEREPTYEYLQRRGVVIFDVLNRIVHRDAHQLNRIRSVHFDDRRLPLRAVYVDGVYLIFATTLSDAELDRTFHPLTVLRPPDARKAG